MATSNRHPYIDATALTQDFLNECAENLVTDINMICEIESSIGTIRLSDKNIYVGNYFYEARCKFPNIIRTLGQYLSGTLEFSSLKIEINNADGKYNSILPTGDNYSGLINKRIIIKIGLKDIASTYKIIFDGKITEQGGIERSFSNIVITARNKFDELNINIPRHTFTLNSYPKIDEANENTYIPILYGDWTTGLRDNIPCVPAIVVNGYDENVNTHYTANVQCVISYNANEYFDTSRVYLKRSDDFYLFNASDIVNVNSDNNYFEVKQGTACSTQINGEPYTYKLGDTFVVAVKGKPLTGGSDNIILQGKDLLKTYAGLTDSDFDSSFATYASNTNVKSRIWLREPVKLFEYFLSLFEQVRLEVFIDNNQKLKINSLRFEDFIASPSMSVFNWDVEKDTFRPFIDYQSYFNRAKAEYAYNPIINEQSFSTPIFKNQAAIDQIGGKLVSKKIVFPNLYVKEEVIYQLKEILKLSSSLIETVECNLTWKYLLLDLGNFLKLKIDVQGLKYEGVPAMVRELGIDPNGIKINAKLWAFTMCPFSGWSPSYAGIVGGYNALITEET